MSEVLLNINGLKTAVEDKEILKGLDLKINKGEIHVIMGPNGAGKSTLANTLMGHPKYERVSGEIALEGEDITELKTDERAKKGLFLSFQHPEEVPGITVENFIRSAKIAQDGQLIKFLKFDKDLKNNMKELKMNPEYAKRYLNVGFSGGEKKKNEILQMLMLNPKLAILDETDSGLDVDAIRIVSEGIKMFANENNGVLIITHNSRILENLNPNFVHVLVNGRIVKTGDASLVKEIEENGYEAFKVEAM